jgi:arylsulfatase A-like enzyme
VPLPREAVTLAERLAPRGYRTGFVGKWHLEPNVTCQKWFARELPEMVGKPRRQVRIPLAKILQYSPEQQGFTEYYWGSMRRYRVNYSLGSGQRLSKMAPVENRDFRIDVQTKAAISFVDRNHDAPFYLQLNYFGPHTPLEAPPRYLRRFPGDMPTRRRYALAMISAIDDGVGQIVERLRRHRILENTLIVMTSDNGAPLKMTKVDAPIGRDPGGWDGSVNDPWVGEKGMLSEGGIRVPMVWSFPKRLPGGKIYPHAVSSLDIAATVVKHATGNTPDELDGVDMLPYLSGTREQAPTRSLYWRFWDQAAIRQGDWKLIHLADGRSFLFDLASDQHEHTNLIGQHADIANSLRKELETWADQLIPAGLPRSRKAMREKRWYDFYFAEQ